MVVDKLVNQLLDNVGSDASNNSDVAADILINCANSSKFYIPEFTSPNIIMSTIHQMVELSSVTFGANSRFIIEMFKLVNGQRRALSYNGDFPFTDPSSVSSTMNIFTARSVAPPGVLSGSSFVFTSAMKRLGKEEFHHVQQLVMDLSALASYADDWSTQLQAINLVRLVCIVYSVLQSHTVQSIRDASISNPDEFY